ncbi:MAG: choice-of-anchor L domain-containing protein, partial [Bacteroidales bacterium]|nr:choice-of-anchor L domain-containing protein [Bacteroidales bacterium]
MKNKVSKVFKRLFSLLIMMTIIVSYGYSQYLTTSNMSLQQIIVDSLINSCGNNSIINLQINTTNCGFGYFNRNNSSFPLNSGLVMTTGPINIANGPDNLTNAGGNCNSAATDPDLVSITNSTIHDAVIIQFDFTPTADFMSFNYIFASEEFPEYVNSINDGFGFFLSGPGISGPYTNGAVNIALLPNGQAATINNIFNANGGAYYVGATSGSGGTGLAYGNSIQYDGATIVLTASHSVIAGQTYHIKLAIGDASDAILDSGVFIEIGSFYMGETSAVGPDDIAIPHTSITQIGTITCDETIIAVTAVGGTDYIWSGGNNPTSEINYFTTPGQYTVTIINNDCQYADNADTITFTISQDMIQPTITIISDPLSATQGVYCPNTVTLNGTDLGPEYYGNWSCPDWPTGSCFSNTTNPQTIVNIGNMYGPHTFTWRETLTINPSCFTEASITIDFGQPYNATLSAIQNKCHHAAAFNIQAINIGNLTCAPPTPAFNPSTGIFTPSLAVAGLYTITNTLPINTFVCAEPRTDTVMFNVWEEYSVTNINVNCGNAGDPVLNISFEVFTLSEGPLGTYIIQDIGAQSSSLYVAPAPPSNYNYIVTDSHNCATFPVTGYRDCSCPFFSGT